MLTSTTDKRMFSSMKSGNIDYMHRTNSKYQTNTSDILSERGPV